MAIKYDVVYYYAPHANANGIPSVGYSWHAAYPTPTDEEAVRQLERMGYHAVAGRRSIGPPEGPPKGDNVPQWSGMRGREIS